MREQLNSELKKSIINKDLAATKTIRLIIAAIKDRDIVVRTEGNQNGISEADIISLLKKMQKQREESTMFEAIVIIEMFAIYYYFIQN